MRDAAADGGEWRPARPQRQARQRPRQSSVFEDAEPPQLELGPSTQGGALQRLPSPHAEAAEAAGCLEAPNFFQQPALSGGLLPAAGSRPLSPLFPGLVLPGESNLIRLA